MDRHIQGTSTDRYGPADLTDVPDAEIQIDDRGGVVLSGIAPPAPPASLAAAPDTRRKQP